MIFVMKEEFLHSIWKLKNFNLHQLKTTDEDELVISHFGTHNHDSGPDFLNAKIVLKKTIWVGHIEIHINSSDWEKHKHQNDRAYDNVILHVVYNMDKSIHNSKGQTIPTLELKSRIDTSLIENYQNLISGLDWIPCAPQLHKIDNQRVSLYLEKLHVERLVTKSMRLMSLLEENKNDWEAAMYALILKYLGLKINGAAFEQLSFQLPFHVFKKYTHNLLQLEALLFGQAGLLHSKDEYIKKLSKEYQHLKKKHELTPMSGVEWQFSRLRPANFPTIRLAQLAMLYHRTPLLFNALILNSDLNHIKEIFSFRASKYWDTHYIPNKTSPFKEKTLGKTTMNILVINAIVPLIFTYSRMLNNQKLTDRSIDILNGLPSEKNQILTHWSQYGINSRNAANSQALIELKTQYCDNYKCLNCHIGQQLLFK